MSSRPQRRAIDARLAQGLAEIKAGRVYGPFESAGAMIAHMKAQQPLSMRAVYTERSRKSLTGLPAGVRKALFKQITFLERNLHHPSLHAKKYDESQDIWQARVNERLSFLLPHPGRRLLYRGHHSPSEIALVTLFFDPLAKIFSLMSRQSLRAAIVCLIAGSWLAAATAGTSQAVPKVLDLFQRLQTAQQQKAQGKPASHVEFRLTEAEVNEYAEHALRTTPRPGLQSVTVKLFPNNYYSTYTVIDFDAVEKWKPGTIPVLLKPVLSGKKSIWVDYRVQAQNGLATFSVEKAYFGSIRLPAFFVQKMIQVVAARQPEHYDTSKPVPLPFGLRKIWTGNKDVSGEN
jgi:hypothetical protein